MEYYLSLVESLEMTLKLDELNNGNHKLICLKAGTLIASLPTRFYEKTNLNFHFQPSKDFCKNILIFCKAVYCQNKNFIINNLNLSDTSNVDCRKIKIKDTAFQFINKNVKHLVIATLGDDFQNNFKIEPTNIHSDDRQVKLQSIT